MPRKFGEIAFTPEVEAAQSQRGSRQTYERYIANGSANDSITLEMPNLLLIWMGFIWEQSVPMAIPIFSFVEERPVS